MNFIGPHYMIIFRCTVQQTLKICTPCNNKLLQMKSPNTFLVSTLTSAISLHPQCPDSDGIIFP